MTAAATTANTATIPPFWRRVLAALGLRRAAWTAGIAVVFALLVSPAFKTPLPEVMARVLAVAFTCLLAYTAAGQWQRPPVPRWLAQVFAVVLAAPLASVFVAWVSAGADWSALVGSEPRLTGMALIGVFSLIWSVVIALGALYRERDAQAEAQALAFALEREKLERTAADARLDLLNSQIEPHFLFNTLANVQALVESGSPRAAPVLASLIAYLRAAVPQLHDGPATLAREASLVRAYLELMQMRMPDRLRWRVDIAPDLGALPLPPLSLLTLVENAVRHGIDPSETGGEIAVSARRDGDGTVRLAVADSGRGIDEKGAGVGTGLANLRERLAAAYAGRASLTLHALEPSGVRAEIEITP